MRNQAFGKGYATASSENGFTIWVHVRGEVYRHGQWTERESWIESDNNRHYNVTGKDIVDAVGIAIPKFANDLKVWDHDHEFHWSWPW